MARAEDRLMSRRRAYDALAPRLASLSDNDLTALLAQTTTWHDHVLGNKSGVIALDGAKVFVKKITLTDLELAPDNRGTSANLFDLPMFYQYGVGSAGFGAWRELQAYLRATGWVLSGECPYFPLVYHWRVLPRARRAPLPAAKQEWLDQAPDYWNGSNAVRQRLAAISAATTSIVLFLEYVPEMLHTWLENRLSGQSVDAALESTFFNFHDQWRAARGFMNDRGMLHFDLHARNVLTDGDQVFVTDFGLALCADFDLSSSERAFFEAHRHYDHAYLDWVVAKWLASLPAPLSPALTDLAERASPAAVAFGDFFEALSQRSRRTPYPEAALEAVFTTSRAAD
ncbi:protein kinase [Phenylobacterium sp. 58.2.17]|uniref:protein kinase n=1 Tax=Phenylobacterium sp. 58.2.17 TaxID=2969306 RepID=UPI0022654E20|nr:protein kinase [Phenylobacterium sp. 58.2.17]MCX7587761.1 protein kinase [Phenylobacterium sp. 58.2.17]